MQEKARRDGRRWKTIVFPRLLWVTLLWYSLLSGEVCKLRIPYSSSTKIHIVVCAITASTVQKMYVARTKKKGSPATSLNELFFFPLERNMKVCENHSSPFFYAVIELNGTELNFWLQKNALSLPWILNCSAFRIVSYRCSSLNRYDSHIFSRTKFKQISHNEHDKYLSLWLNQKPLLLHPRAFN